MSQSERLAELKGALSKLKYEDIKPSATLCREAFSNLQRAVSIQASAQFHVGQAVQFQSKKKFGQVVKGKIESINTKSISLITEAKERWRVTPSLLTACN